MYSIPSTSSYYDFGNYSNSANFLQRVFESTTNSPPTNSRSAAEEKAIAANRSHSEAERRRRKRINDHLSTLRSLLPNTVKTDKASLLAEVVRRLRELKDETLDLGEITNQCSIPMLPSESNELRLSYCGGEVSGTIEATVCCDDRPELVEELRRAVRSVEGKVVRAEMATIGGRTKSVLWVELPGGGEGGLGRLQRALKAIVERSDSCVTSSTLAEELGGGGGGGNKRARRLCGY